MVEKQEEYSKLNDNVASLLKIVADKIAQRDYTMYSKILDGLLKELAPDHMRIYAVLHQMRRVVEARLEYAIATERGGDEYRLENIRDDILKRQFIAYLSRMYKVAYHFSRDIGR